VDKNGTLDKGELTALLAESIKGQRTFLPQQIDTMFDATLKYGMELAVLLHAPSDELKEAKKTLPAQVKDLKVRALKQLTEVLDGLMRDIKPLADQLFNKLDEDHDLKVTKDEFVRNFHRCYNELVNISGILAMMQQSVSE